MPEPIWVAELRISQRVAEKLVSKHSVHAEHVRLAIVGARGLRGAWYDDPDRGRRAVTKATIGGVPFVLVLYPVLHPMGGVWRLGTAYPERRWT